DGDKGPNTGGMGAYAPYPGVNEEALSFIEEKILKRTLEALKKENIDFKGVLYAGLMLTKEGPKVLEFNVRFGDPETQAILPLLKTNLLDLLLACEEGELEKFKKLEWKDGYCVCVVIASGGYPGPYEKGKLIEGVEKAEEESCIVFHAGTKLMDGKLFTDGGRVLGVAGIEKTLPLAIEKAYRGVEKIKFSGMYFRKDIGKKGLKFVQ
ncbi:MAG TPA: phosphoribosylamine--glycine ligase, partial [bacterium]|nr:phosphoribosylamine--glycine ligase [bacterium]HEX68549.1 phosphoribosylamine--glycine ligase [bacterium]